MSRGDGCMTGLEYLKDIQAQLELGRYQHRMGENLLRAFGTSGGELRPWRR